MSSDSVAVSKQSSPLVGDGNRGSYIFLPFIVGIPTADPSPSQDGDKKKGGDGGNGEQRPRKKENIMKFLYISLAVLLVLVNWPRTRSPLDEMYSGKFIRGGSVDAGINGRTRKGNTYVPPKIKTSVLEWVYAPSPHQDTNSYHVSAYEHPTFSYAAEIKI